MDHITVDNQQALCLVLQAQTTARVWQCNSCGLKLFLAQKSEYPKLRCLCGRSYWKSCPETEK